MDRDFNEWLKGFRRTIYGFKYYTDFEKVYKNVDAMKTEFCLLNSLVGSKDIEKEFEELLNKYPEVLKCIPILLAVRAEEILIAEPERELNFSFDKRNYDIKDYSRFMRETGLFNLLKERIINNVLDYVTGVEVGLDSNARKNRGGHCMEDLVEFHIKRAGFERDKTYFKEMYATEIEKKWHLDLSELSNEGQTAKRFDFVIKTSNMVYGIEVNFYSGGGSKLNETARSYKTLALEARKINGFTFMWITDGRGWISARNNLAETFKELPTLYCLKELEEGVFNKIPK